MVFIESAFHSTISSLKNLTILDFRTIIHVFNNLFHFTNFQKISCEEYLLADSSEVSVLSYGDIILRVSKEKSMKKTLRLKNVTFCTDFVTNLVSFRLLQIKEIH